MNPRRWFFLLTMVTLAGRGVCADATEAALQKPGAIIAVEVTGAVTASFGDQRKNVKTDERLRVDSTIITGRKSAVKLLLSNAAMVQLGSESEIEFEEFRQATFSGSTKFAEMKEEPSISRTRVRLARGDVNIDVKPLNASKGSSFLFSFAAGTLRTSEGSFRAMVRMTDLGLGVCSLELTNGKAEFEVAGGKFERMPLGAKLAFALEVDKATGTITVGEMPKPNAKAGAAKDD
jgi:hypothetical protein